MIRVALFASGNGTNALNLIRTAQSLRQLQIPIVIVDQPSSLLPEKIKTEFPEVLVSIIPAPLVQDVRARRVQHESKILKVLQTHRIDWCFLAGYMRLIGPTFLSAFQNDTHSKVVNIHPSLLPAYPGTHAYEDAYTTGDKFSGITVHFVDEGVDTGPIIAQKSFERKENDTLEQFKARGLHLEWQLYASVLKQLNDEQTLTVADPYLARNT